MRFCMGAENAKMKSAEKSAETGGHPRNTPTISYIPCFHHSFNMCSFTLIPKKYVHFFSY